MFRFILIFIITLMHAYVVWRVVTVPYINRHVPRLFLISTGLFLWLCFCFSIVYGRHGSGTPSLLLTAFAMHWMAILFLLIICLLAIDVVTVFGVLLPRLAPSLRGLALLAGCILSVFALFQGLRPPVVTQYTALLPNLPEDLHGTVIVAMSDMHLGSLIGERWLENRVAQVQEQQPDLVVLLGDIFDKPQEKLIPILTRFSAPLGVWGVLGNHEFYGNETASTSLIHKSGIYLLRNTNVAIRSGLVLAGVDDLTIKRRSGRGSEDIAQALTNRPPGTTILLSHSPLQAETAAKDGVQLMLSGHTHGGQIWPFGYLVRRWYPRFAGVYTVDNMSLIVSRGTGTWGPRMRLWRPGEILRITLLKR